MAKKIPKFSYTGAYETSSDDTYWYIKLKSSGQMTFTYRKRIEVGCVGGGGGTISNRNYAHIGGFAGGGGGYIKRGRPRLRQEPHMRSQSARAAKG